MGRKYPLLKDIGKGNFVLSTYMVLSCLKIKGLIMVVMVVMG